MKSYTIWNVYFLKSHYFWVFFPFYFKYSLVCCSVLHFSVLCNNSFLPLFLYVPIFYYLISHVLTKAFSNHSLHWLFSILLLASFSYVTKALGQITPCKVFWYNYKEKVSRFLVQAKNHHLRSSTYDLFIQQSFLFGFISPFTVKQ